MSETRFELHLEINAPDRAATRLAQETGLSKRALKEVMAKGALWLERGRRTTRLRRAAAEVRPGDCLHLYYDPAVLSQEPPPAALVADLGAYSAWAKPAGMLSQGSKWGDHCTIERWAERELRPERSAYPVHRLDRATRGLILLAHTKAAAAALSAEFRARRVEKRYRAWVQGCGAPLLPGAEPLALETPLDGKPARSLIRVLRAEGQNTLIEVAPETGRKHQIRRHLSELGFPLVGDRLYGGAAAADPDLALCAVGLRLRCPLTNEERELALPPEWAADFRE